MTKIKPYDLSFRNSLVFLLIAVSVMINLLASFCYANEKNSFYEQRYRGWLWFEENKNSSTKRKKNSKAEAGNITPAKAKEEVERFAKELENLKYVMLARPTVENVKAYRDKEEQMWTGAMKLYDSATMANFLYPEQRDLINNPVNVHAVKAKRQFDYEEDEKRIKQFAKDFDLVLVFNSACKYCELLSPVLQSFSIKYGFNIEAISVDGSQHPYFKTSYLPDLVKNLGIDAFPVVIAVGNNEEIEPFELIRGYVSISELEEYSVLASKYLEEKQQGQKAKRVGVIR
jgi:conjugal transfer pilus assembly protein TraF